MTLGVSSPPSGQQTPILAPAESGPSSGRPELGSMRTNEPVPAPIESTWTSGRLRMKRPKSGVGVIWNSPSVISAMSKEVPPISVQTTFGRPSFSARYRAPMTPPIGPEISVRASSRASTEIVPPCAAMIAQIERRPRPRG